MLPLRQNYAHVGIGKVKREGVGGMYSHPLLSHPPLCLCHGSLQRISHAFFQDALGLAPFGNVNQDGDK